MKSYKVSDVIKANKTKKFALLNGASCLIGSILVSIRIFTDFNEYSLILKFILIIVILGLLFIIWRYLLKSYINKLNSIFEITKNHLIIKTGNGTILSYELNEIKNVTFKGGKLFFEFKNKNINIPYEIDNIEDFIQDLKNSST